MTGLHFDYEKEFADYTTLQLVNITGNPSSYQPEAIAAAQRLLDARPPMAVSTIAEAAPPTDALADISAMIAAAEVQTGRRWRAGTITGPVPAPLRSHPDVVWALLCITGLWAVHVALWILIAERGQPFFLYLPHIINASILSVGLLLGLIPATRKVGWFYLVLFLGINTLFSFWLIAKQFLKEAPVRDVFPDLWSAAIFLLTTAGLVFSYKSGSRHYCSIPERGAKVAAMVSFLLYCAFQLLRTLAE